MSSSRTVQPRRRRWGLAICITVVVLGLAAAGYVLWRVYAAGPPASAAGHRPPTLVAGQPKGLPTSDTTRLQQALSSPDRATQATALVPEERAGFLAQGNAPFARGTKVTIDPASFRRNAKAATVLATTSHGKTWALHLFLEDGKWFIVYTQKGS